MKCKRILSVSLAAALLLMNAPSSALAAENIKPQQAEEASVSRVLPKEDFEAAEPAAKAVPVSGAAAEFTPSSADPYTLTADDVNLAQCREDDGDSNTPFIDAVMITGYKDIDLSDDRYTNIVIPETLPFEKPVLDDDGREKKDDEGKVITETVVMPVIKAYRLNHANLEKLTVSKNLVYLDSFEGCSKLSEIVIPDDSQLENFGANTFSSNSASVTPKRPAINVPTLPRIPSLILSESCVMNWLATIKLRRNFLASDKIDSKLSVEKFWNSSTNRQKSLRSSSGVSTRLIAAVWNFITKIIPSSFEFNSPILPFDRFTSKIFLLSIMSRN